MVDASAGRPSDNNRILALKIIDDQIQRKLAMKRGPRKKIKQAVERLFRYASYRVLNRPKVRVKPYDGSSMLGADEFKRDIADGIAKYVQLLRSRGLQIHTVIVLGSRVKGRWKPTSDVDVTIISSKLPPQKEGFSVRKLLGIGSGSVLSDKPLSLGIEPSGCCSKDEFIERIENLNVEALDALYYGLVFYDDGFWKKARQKLRETEQKYQLSRSEMRKKLQYV